MQELRTTIAADTAMQIQQMETRVNAKLEAILGAIRQVPHASRVMATSPTSGHIELTMAGATSPASGGDRLPGPPVDYATSPRMNRRAK